MEGAESENKTLFDELAGLVPAERQAEYYRVIAHTRTLSPNDEVLRVLEAMGMLALLTRETPAAISAGVSRVINARMPIASSRRSISSFGLSVRV